MNRRAYLLLLVLAGCAFEASSQLFTNLTALGSRVRVGDPSVRATNSLDGPKGIVTADFNNDGRPDLAVANTDGTVTLLRGMGQGRFAPPEHLQTGVQELRGIVAADFTGDGRIDLALAAPYAAQVLIFVNSGEGFEAPVTVPTWAGARNLVAGDFNGDSRVDLMVAGTTNGLQQLRNDGSLHFVGVGNLPQLGAFNPDFPKPLYAMTAYRPFGAVRDELIVTHADSTNIWVLSANAGGILELRATFNTKSVHALVVGSILQASNSTRLDLVKASRDFGTIEVYPGVDGLSRFAPNPTQELHVPGGPRALALADLDGDGWNDLVVVLRNFDRVLNYHNSNGVLVAVTETPVGRSPRELVANDFNGDGRPDVAVMNRDSEDVSVLLTYPGQTSFTSLDQLYPVDGEVTGLALFDFNRDGRDDVVQLHRASAEFSVRLAGTNGLLGPPSFYPMGALPSAQAVVDVNNDGITDMVTANLGRGGQEPGSVSLRLGDGEGGFGPEQRYTLPSGTSGNLFALVAADFDGDGDIDLAAGFFDCRLAFFENIGGGKFEFTRSHQFVYEARVMVAGDFDGDGDIDLAGAGYAGDVVVIENVGELLHSPGLVRKDYPASSSRKFGTRDIVAADVNNDGDLDLLVGSGDGTMLFLGDAGVAFIKMSDKLPGTDFPASAVTLGDFDHNGTRDVAVACRILSCVTILSSDTNGQYQPALTVDVPSGEFLASGDLDGDGRADLVGSGSVLWTALSSRRAQPVPASAAPATRRTEEGLRLNELLAINTDLPLAADGNRTSDWVELFNASPSPLSLAGWSLQLVAEPVAEGSNVFQFPITSTVTSKGYLLVIFSEIQRTLYHTGFRLPGGGGTLLLRDATGREVDRVRYGPQQENVSYGRYRDALPALAFNPYPSPGRPNTDNGPVEPTARIVGLSPMPPGPGQPVRFIVEGRDDVGIIGLSVLWRRLDVPQNDLQRVVLYDDGMHDDGGVLDGRFSGVLEPNLPPGAELQFFLEITDLNGLTVLEPNEPVLAAGGQLGTRFTLAIGGTPPPVELSEFVAWNETGLQDERGLTPDWLELRNCSLAPISLRGVSVGPSYFGGGSRYTFPESAVLAPGAHTVVYCDQNPGAGERHAGFAINRAGDRLTLAATTTNGARLFLDEVSLGPQARDVAWARLGCGGPWHPTTPTPSRQNVAGAWQGLVLAETDSFALVFPTTTNATYVVEQAESLSTSLWQALPPIAGDGTEKVVRTPLMPQQFYRVRREQ
jgi:hypothetical protein